MFIPNFNYMVVSGDVDVPTKYKELVNDNF